MKQFEALQRDGLVPGLAGGPAHTNGRNRPRRHGRTGVPAVAMPHTAVRGHGAVATLPHTLMSGEASVMAKGSHPPGLFKASFLVQSNLREALQRVLREMTVCKIHEGASSPSLGVPPFTY